MLPRPIPHSRPAAADTAAPDRSVPDARDAAARPTLPGHRARPSVLGGAQQRLNFFGPPEPHTAGKTGR